MRGIQIGAFASDSCASHTFSALWKFISNWFQLNYKCLRLFFFLYFFFHFFFARMAEWKNNSEGKWCLYCAGGNGSIFAMKPTHRIRSLIDRSAHTHTAAHIFPSSFIIYIFQFSFIHRMHEMSRRKKKWIRQKSEKNKTRDYVMLTNKPQFKFKCAHRHEFCFQIWFDIAVGVMNFIFCFHPSPVAIIRLHGTRCLELRCDSWL